MLHSAGRGVEDALLADAVLRRYDLVLDYMQACLPIKSNSHYGERCD